eukprot:gene8818-10453_t
MTQGYDPVPEKATPVAKGPTAKTPPPRKSLPKGAAKPEKIEKPEIPTKPESELKFSLLEETTRPAGGWSGPASADMPPPNKGKKPTPRGADGCLAGLTMVISGVLDSLERHEMADFVQRHGGKVTGSVSGKTDFLILGMSAGRSKYTAAQAKGTKLIDEDTLFDYVRSTKPQPAEDTMPSTKPIATQPGEPLATSAVEKVPAKAAASS